MSESIEPGRRKIVFGSKRRNDLTGAAGGDSGVIDEVFPEARTVIWYPITRGSQTAAPEPEGEVSTPEVQPYALVVTQEVLLNVSEHVSETLEHELGGFLLGDLCRCPNTGRDYVLVDVASPAKHTTSTEVSLDFTEEAWAQLSDELHGKFRNKLLVGWYHSHPKMDVFLSRHDMQIQEDRKSVV